MNTRHLLNYPSISISFQGSKIANNFGSLEKPFWLMDLTLENFIGFNLYICFGIALLFKKYGLAGLLPLMIQTGYFLGSSAAMTSGERYLMPVGWVTSYYCVGLMWSISTISFIVFQTSSHRFFSLATDEPQEVLPVQSNQSGTLWHYGCQSF